MNATALFGSWVVAAVFLLFFLVVIGTGSRIHHERAGNRYRQMRHITRFIRWTRAIIVIAAMVPAIWLVFQFPHYQAVLVAPSLWAAISIVGITLIDRVALGRAKVRKKSGARILRCLPWKVIVFLVLMGGVLGWSIRWAWGEAALGGRNHVDSWVLDGKFGWASTSPFPGSFYTLPLIYTLPVVLVLALLAGAVVWTRRVYRPTKFAGFDAGLKRRTLHDLALICLGAVAPPCAMMGLDVAWIYATVGPGSPQRTLVVVVASFLGAWSLGMSFWIFANLIFLPPAREERTEEADSVSLGSMLDTGRDKRRSRRAPVAQPVGAAAEVSAGPIMEAPVEAGLRAPAEAMVGIPPETMIGVPSGATVVAPVESGAGTPVGAIVETSADVPYGPGAEPTVETAVEIPPEPTVEPTAKATMEVPAGPTEEPTVEAKVEAPREPTVGSIVEATGEPIVEATGEPTVKATGEPTVESTAEAIVEVPSGPTAKTTAEVIPQVILVTIQNGQVLFAEPVRAGHEVEGDLYQAEYDVVSLEIKARTSETELPPSGVEAPASGVEAPEMEARKPEIEAPAVEARAPETETPADESEIEAPAVEAEAVSVEAAIGPGRSGTEPGSATGVEVHGDLGQAEFDLTDDEDRKRFSDSDRAAPVIPPKAESAQAESEQITPDAASAARPRSHMDTSHWHGEWDSSADEPDLSKVSAAAFAHTPHKHPRKTRFAPKSKSRRRR